MEHHFERLDPAALVLGRRDSRGNVGFAPFYRVQVPAARCVVEPRPGYYSVVVHLERGRPAHDAFASKVRALERQLSEMGFDARGLSSLVKDDGRMYLSVRDDTEWFDADGANIRGSISVFPPDFRGVSLLVELCKVWTSRKRSADGDDATTWGLRATCLQAKRADPSRLRSAQPLFLDDD